MVIIRPDPIDVAMTLEGLSQKKDCAMSISDRAMNCLNEWQNISSTCIRSCIDTIPSEKKILRPTVFHETDDFSEVSP